MPESVVWIENVMQVYQVTSHKAQQENNNRKGNKKEKDYSITQYFTKTLLTRDNNIIELLFTQV